MPFYTDIRWLSRGKFLEKVFQLRENSLPAVRAFHLCELHGGDQKKELVEQLAVTALEDSLRHKTKKIVEAKKSSGEPSAKLQRVTTTFKTFFLFTQEVWPKQGKG